MAVWSEVRFSKLATDIRIDSEYYRPEHLRLDGLLSKKRATRWGDLDGTFIVGPFGSAFLVSNYVNHSPFRYIRGRDVKPFFLLDDVNCYIPGEDFDRLSRYRLQIGDLLVSVVGTLGNVSVVTRDVEKAIFSCKSTAYRSNSLNPFYLCALLNSRIGQSYLHRMVRGHVQTGLNLADLMNIPIFVPQKRLETRISKIVQQSHSQLQDSKNLYNEAEALLLRELGLDALDTSPTLFYERSFTETQQAGRLDAEFYQPIYYKLIEAIRNTKNAVRLGNVLSRCDRGMQPEYDDDGDISVVNTKHLGAQFLSSDFERCNVASWEKQKKARLKKYDVLLYGTGAYIGRTNCFLGDMKAIGSNHVTIIRPTDDCNPVYLSLFLNSKAGLMQAYRHAHGSAQRELYPADIREFTFWLPPMKVQEEFADMILNAHAAFEESKRLLEEAKRMVEEAILNE